MNDYFNLKENIIQKNSTPNFYDHYDNFPTNARTKSQHIIKDLQERKTVKKNDEYSRSRSIMHKIDVLSEKIEKSLLVSERNLKNSPKNKFQSSFLRNKENDFLIQASQEKIQYPKSSISPINKKILIENSLRKNRNEDQFERGTIKKQTKENENSFSPTIKAKMKKIRSQTGFDMESIIDDIYSLLN